MVNAQGEIWWADLGDPVGSEPGYRRPVLVVQCDRFNNSRIATVVCVTLTSNLRLAHATGTVRLTERQTHHEKNLVADVSTRHRAGEGKSASGQLDLGGQRIIKKKKNN